MKAEKLTIAMKAVAKDVLIEDMLLYYLGVDDECSYEDLPDKYIRDDGLYAIIESLADNWPMFKDMDPDNPLYNVLLLYLNENVHKWWKDKLQNIREEMSRITVSIIEWARDPARTVNELRVVQTYITSAEDVHIAGHAYFEVKASWMSLASIIQLAFTHIFEMFPADSAYGPEDLKQEIGPSAYVNWKKRDGWKVCISGLSDDPIEWDDLPDFVNITFEDGYVIDAISSVHVEKRA